MKTRTLNVFSKNLTSLQDSIKKLKKEEFGQDHQDLYKEIHDFQFTLDDLEKKINSNGIIKKTIRNKSNNTGFSISSQYVNKISSNGFSHL